jgi:glycyl-tRNA synthetase (class II)
MQNLNHLLNKSVRLFLFSISLFFQYIYIADLLTQVGISHKIDTSSSAIGKRYARCDEIAIPFAIAIDFDTLQQPHSIALRELDSLKQIRVKVNVEF